MKENTSENLVASLRYIFAKTQATDAYLVFAHFWSAIAKVALSFVAIFLPRTVINALTEPNPSVDAMLQLLVPLAAALLFISLTATIADNYVSGRAHLARSKVLIDINTKSMAMDYAYVESATGQIARQKAYSATRSQNSGAQTVIPNVAALVAHVLGLGLYAAITASLNIWVTVVLCVAAVLNYRAVKVAQNYEASRRDELAKVYRNLEYIQETALDYHVGKDIRLYTMGAWLEKLFHTYLKEHLDILAAVFRRHFTVDVLSTVLDVVRDGVAYYYLITLVVSRQIGIGDFTLYFAAVAGIAQWITSIISDISGMRSGCRDISYVQQYLAIAPPATEGSTTTLSGSSAAPTIVFDNVSFRYPESETWTLRHFNLIISAGEKLALVGINGAGKTTCIKLLTGLYQPTEGRILLDGQDISMMSREECYALFSVVFQEAMPLAMSLRENIALANEESIDEAKVEDCIERAGLATMVAGLSRGANTELTRFLDEHGMDLSGGQTQRLMLARALYKNAPVILLDEPTAALDPIAEAEMYERYSQLVGFKTSVYISHRLASTRFCDRIAFLENGRLVEIGSHADLIAAKGKYAEMYLVQSQYYQEDYAGGELDGK